MIKNEMKDRILYAFNLLLREMPFENISVIMIVEKAEISRSTFYRYFLDIYDVMNYNYKKIIDDVFKFDVCNNWKDLFIVILTNSIQDTVRLKNAFASGGIHSYPNFLYQYSYRLIKETAKTVRKIDKISEEESCLASVLCYGSVWAIHDWVNHNLDLSLEQMAIQLDKMVPDCLRDLWQIKEMDKKYRLKIKENVLNNQF